MSTQAWTEKYRPKTLDEVLGNPKAIRELRAWANAWAEGEPEERGAILAGDPGLGKTSAALALASDMGWSPIELNASDARNKDVIERVATRGALSQGFTESGEYQTTGQQQRKLIIFDEADNVFGREDRGGMQQMVETLRETKHPIVFIANDSYALSRKSSTLGRLSVEIEFNSVQESTIAKILRRICKEEDIQAEIPAIEALAEHAGGDVRAAISDLESIARGTGTLTLEDVDALGYRDTKSTIFDALRTILQADDFQEAKQASYDLDEDPETLLLWIEENVPREYQDPGDRARAMDTVARADTFLGATQRTRHYRFWAYASDLMTGGVAASREGRASGWTRYQFPTYLRKMGRSRKARNVRSDLELKVAQTFHSSTARAREDVIPAFRFIAERSEPFAVAITAAMELNDDELALLLDTKKSSSTVERILGQAEELERGRPREGHHDEGGRLADPVWEREGYEAPPPEEDTEPEPAQEEDEADPDTEDEDSDDESQVSLFEF